MSSIGLGLGSGLGSGLLGQLSDVASAPRRAVWSMFGLPEEGAEAVAKLTGMDASNPWAQALGVGAEVALDPMNLLGAPLLSRAGSLMSRLGPKYNRLLSEAEIASQAATGAGKAFRGADAILDATRGAVNQAGDLGQGFTNLDHAYDAERAVMGNRFSDEMTRLQGIGDNVYEASLDPRVMNRSTARDALIPTESGPPLKRVALTPEAAQGMQAMGLAPGPTSANPDIGGRFLDLVRGGMGVEDAAVAVARPGGMASHMDLIPQLGPIPSGGGGRQLVPPLTGPGQGYEMAGRRRGVPGMLTPTADAPFIPPPGNNPSIPGHLGFGPNTQTRTMEAMQGAQQNFAGDLTPLMPQLNEHLAAKANQDAAKNLLLEALGARERANTGLEAYNLKALSPLEQWMMAAGVGSMATPIGRELGRQ